MDIKNKKEILTGKYFKYAKAYQAWKDQYHDDRGLYQNMYEHLLEALYTMENIENTFIICAFNDKFEEERKVLDEIIERFEKMGKETK